MGALARRDGLAWEARSGADVCINFVGDRSPAEKVAEQVKATSPESSGGGCSPSSAAMSSARARMAGQSSTAARTSPITRSICPRSSSSSPIWKLAPSSSGTTWKAHFTPGVKDRVTKLQVQRMVQALLALAKGIVGFDRAFGRRDAVDPVRHLLGAVFQIRSTELAGRKCFRLSHRQLQRVTRQLQRIEFQVRVER